MKKKALSFLALAGLVLSPAARAQDQAAVFKPAGQWTADFGDDYCRLIRTFSDGKDEISLAFQRVQPGVTMRLLLVGDGIKTFRSADQIGYAFLPSGSTGKTRYARSETADGRQFLIFDPLTLAPFAPPEPGMPPAPYDREGEQEIASGVQGIALDEGLTDPVRIETGSLKAAMTVMQACADDLLKVWGLDPERQKTQSAPAVPNFSPDGWLPQGTIPFGEFGKFAGGANQVRLMIGVDGKPTSCAIYSPTLSEALNGKICDTLMKNASFQPAKDSAGQAMASYWMGSPLFLGPPIPGGR